VYTEASLKRKPLAALPVDEAEPVDDVSLSLDAQRLRQHKQAIRTRARRKRSALVDRDDKALVGRNADGGGEVLLESADERGVVHGPARGERLGHIQGERHVRADLRRRCRLARSHCTARQTASVRKSRIGERDARQRVTVSLFITTGRQVKPSQQRNGPEAKQSMSSDCEAARELRQDEQSTERTLVMQ